MKHEDSQDRVAKYFVGDLGLLNRHRTRDESRASKKYFRVQEMALPKDGKSVSRRERTKIISF